MEGFQVAVRVDELDGGAVCYAGDASLWVKHLRV